MKNVFIKIERKKIVLYDAALNTRFANEYFNSLEETKEFCDQNNLTLLFSNYAFDRINWDLLQQQKQALILNPFSKTKEGDGLLGLLDGLQDFAVFTGISESKVFPNSKYKTV
jgi:hypothetical protein